MASDEADTPLGFITLLTPGTAAYTSDNLRWFEDWIAANDATLLYVDRIAIAERARGKRLGEKLYLAAFEQAKGCDYIGCEVNTDPDNPGSHRFHQRLGFHEIGRKRYKPDYEVAYYVREV